MAVEIEQPEGAYAVHCPNLRCGLVFKPDPRIYRRGDLYCPRCGADLNQRPAIFGRKEIRDG